MRYEARRARAAAETTCEMYLIPSGAAEDGRGQGWAAVDRFLTRPPAEHARAMLDRVAADAPHSDAAVHLAVLMLTLRAARGTANITGADLTRWLRGDAERVLYQLVDTGWLRLPGSVAQLLASRPESPTQVTIPTLLPEHPQPFFGKTARSRISSWAQKVIGDRHLRKTRAGAATWLLALSTAAHAAPHGRLGHAMTTGCRWVRRPRSAPSHRTKSRRRPPRRG